MGGNALSRLQEGIVANSAITTSPIPNSPLLGFLSPRHNRLGCEHRFADGKPGEGGALLEP
jgi:hypothetical protein